MFEKGAFCGSLCLQALFTYNRSAGAYWFNVALTASPRLRQLYRFFGWIMGQAMCNRCTLGVPLPELLFRILLVGPAEFAYAPNDRRALSSTASSVAYLLLE